MQREDVSELIQSDQRGYYSKYAPSELYDPDAGRWHNNPIREMLRKEAEQCDRGIVDFILNSSTYGRTGYSLGKQVCYILEEEFPRSNLICNQLVSSPSMQGLDFFEIRNHIKSF